MSPLYSYLHVSAPFKHLDATVRYSCHCGSLFLETLSLRLKPKSVILTLTFHSFQKVAQRLKFEHFSFATQELNFLWFSGKRRPCEGLTLDSRTLMSKLMINETNQQIIH